MIHELTPQDIEFFKPLKRVPDEVAEERLQNRLKSPKARQMLNESLAEMGKSLQLSEHPWIDDKRFCVASYNLGAVMIFGDKAKMITWETPYQIRQKEVEMLSEVESMAQEFKSKNVLGILRKANVLPVPYGSKCDRGEFDDYDQEILMHVSGIREDVKKLLVPTKIPREKDFENYGMQLEKVLAGFRANDRDVVLTAESQMIRIRERINHSKGENIATGFMRRFSKKKETDEFKKALDSFETLLNREFLS